MKDTNDTNETNETSYQIFDVYWPEGHIMYECRKLGDGSYTLWFYCDNYEELVFSGSGLHKCKQAYRDDFEEKLKFFEKALMRAKQ